MLLHMIRSISVYSYSSYYMLGISARCLPYSQHVLRASLVLDQAVAAAAAIAIAAATAAAGRGATRWGRGRKQLHRSLRTVDGITIRWHLAGAAPPP